MSLHWVLRPGWTGGLRGLWFCSNVKLCRCGGAACQPQRTEPCQYVSGQLRACHGPLQGQNAASAVCWSLYWVLRPGWEGALRGLRFLLYAGVLQLWRRCSPTRIYRALPACEWPALGILWAPARSNAAFAVCSRCDGACTGCCGRAGQQVV